MAASIMPMTALADGDTVLYSDSFNGYPTSERSATGTVFAACPGSQYGSVQDNADWQWIFNSPTSRELDKLTVGFEGDGDDTATIMINEKEEASDKYLMMPRNRFPGRAKPQITGLDAYSANAGESLVIDFKAMLQDGDQSAILSLGDVGTLTSTELGTNEWKEVKLVVADGSTTIYVDGEAVGSPAAAVPSVIKPEPFTENTKCSAYPSVSIDDLVIMSSANGADATIPAAEDHSISDDPTETSAPAAAAPAFKAHSTAQKLYSQTFNAAATGLLISIGTEAQDPNTSIPGVEFRVGNRGSGADTSSYASVSKLADDDNVLKIAGGKFASNGRGVRMALADNLSIADTELTSIMAFAFKLDPAQDGGKGQLYLLDNDTNVDGNGVARDFLAVFTTDGNGASYANGDTKIGVDVTAGEWHTAMVAVSNGSYRVYIDGNTDDPAVKGEKVNSGATAKAVTNLPIIAATNAKSGSENYSLVTVDNLMAYQISASFEKKYLPESAETQEDIMPGDTPSETSAPSATSAPSGVVKNPAPKLVPPSDATVSINQLDFSTELSKKILGTESQDITDIEGLNIHIGSRSATDSTTYAETSDYVTGDKVLKLAGGSFSTAGRGPVVSAVTPLAHDDTTSSVMTFAVNLTSEAEGGKGKLYILGTTRQAGSDGSGAYNAVMATLSTEAADGEYQVDADTWYKVAVITSSDKFRIWIAKADEDFDTSAQISADHLGQGSSAVHMEDLGLPYLAVTSAKGSDSGTNSIVRIDNLSTYTGTNGASGPRNLLPSTVQADAYRVFTVNYDGEGRLTSATSEVVTDASAITPVLDGNTKKFVWKTNSKGGMEPISVEN